LGHDQIVINRSYNKALKNIGLEIMKKPDFLIIGAQKTGTTWLWEMIKQHPETDLPKIKEIHYFGSSEIHHKGRDWYFNHFKDVNPMKLTGEASTTNLYDYVPFWHNPESFIKYDMSLPSIPELILKEMPDVKIIISLRDPVKRAISAHLHLLRANPDLSPFDGLTKIAQEKPKMRILEYGYYAKYIKFWLNFIESERIYFSIFEEDVLKSSDESVQNIYKFLNIDPTFKPQNLKQKKNKSWTWTRVVTRYSTKRIPFISSNPYLGRFCDKFDVLGKYAVKDEDVEFLRSKYLPEKPELERLLSRNLDLWTYNK